MISAHVQVPALQRSLRMQLILALGLLSALVATVSITALWGLDRVSGAAHQALTIDGRISSLSSRLAIESMENDRLGQDFIHSLDGPAAERALIAEDWASEFEELDETIEEFAGAATAAADREAAARWRTTFDRYSEGVAQLQQGAAAGQLATAEQAAAFFEPYESDIYLLEIEATELAEGKILLLPQSEARVNGIIADTRVFVIAITLVTLALALAWSILFPNRLMQPIKALQEATGRLARGDLAARVALKRSDELGLLAHSFNQMADELGKAQQRLETWNQTLERTVEERTTQLAHLTAEAQQARTAAEQANEMKSQFLANMSHELRTPLNSIINFTRILSTGMRGPVNEAQLDYLNRVRMSGEHLLGLINDILDLSKIESGRMELYLETIDLTEIVQGVLSTAAGLIKGKPIELRSEIAPGLPSIQVDRVRIRQILLNLLSNAAKFTDQGAITTRVAYEKGYITVSVTDTGIGIASEHLQAVFEEFRQIESTTSRRYEGTGLGLAICRRLIELHGGRIWAESTPEVGSTFAFTLPVAITQPAPQLSAPQDAEQREGIPVLVIDDDPAAIEIVAVYLEREGYAVHGISDSRHVIEVARSIRPAAIILDVLMPYKDGWEVLAELKADPELQAIPVALYTIVEEQKLGFYLGASAYLVKPVDADLLHTTVARLVAENTTILVIDDDANAREIVTHQLEMANAYHVVSADGGRAGLDRIAATLPDLVILDLMMPEVDGFAVLDELARHPHTSHIPVIVLTAKSLTSQERAMLQQRVNGLLIKGSATAEQLLSHVSTLLEKTTRAPAGVLQRKD